MVVALLQVTSFKQNCSTPTKIRLKIAELDKTLEIGRQPPFFQMEDNLNTLKRM